MKNIVCLFMLLVVLFLGSCASRNSAANLASNEHTLSNSCHNTEQAGPSSGCKRDEDCMLTKEKCCGCNEGGKQIAISKPADLKAYENKVKKECAQTMCAQHISLDQSCAEGVKAECKAGRCTLKPTGQ